MSKKPEVRRYQKPSQDESHQSDMVDLSKIVLYQILKTGMLVKVCNRADHVIPLEIRITNQIPRRIKGNTKSKPA